MKKLLVFLSTAIIVLGFAGRASAIPFVDVNGDRSGGWAYLAEGESATWIFDLDNDSLAVGDISSSDIIDSAFLRILFWDNDWDYSPRTLEFGFLNIEGDGTVTGEIDTGIVAFDVLGYLADHELTLTVASLSGDFTVPAVVLQGEYSSVPEPSTLLLLGVGFLGLGIMLRRKNRTALLYREVLIRKALV